MRNTIAKWMRSYYLNQDGTANVSCSTLKRRTIVVVGFSVMRIWDLLKLTSLPFLFVFVFVAKTIKALVETIDTSLIDVRRVARDIGRDVRDCNTVWNDEHGVGTLSNDRFPG